jgi:hypothetical protein
MPELEHGDVPLFAGADNCGHPEPDEPDTEHDGSPGWAAHDAYFTDHQTGADGERICLLTPDGTACRACTETAREEEDLPIGEYVACRLAKENDHA